MPIPIVTLTTGQRGAGKTLRRGPHFLVNEWLPEHEGVIWTNLPLYRDLIAEFVVKRMGKGKADDLMERIQIIPPEELKKWAAGTSGPWDFFREIDLRGGHVQIDEVQNFYPVDAKANARAELLRQWLSEVRHGGFTVEFITQAPMDCHNQIRRAAKIKLHIMTDEDDRDWFFKIKMACWYELLAGFFTGKYRPVCREIEQKKDENEKWVENGVTRFLRENKYFKLYDSYSKPHSGGVKAQAQKQEFEKRTKTGLLVWFVMFNFNKIGSKLLILLLFLACCLFLYSGKADDVFLFAMSKTSGGAALVVPEGDDAAEVVEVYGPEQVDLAAEASFSRELVQLDDPPVEVDPLPVIQDVMSSPEYLQVEQKLVELREKTVKRDSLLERMGAAVMMGEDWVILADGFRYDVGEFVDGGVWDGLMVESIDWKRRIVRLDDGTHLRLGVGVVGRLQVPDDDTGGDE